MPGSHALSSNHAPRTPLPCIPISFKPSSKSHEHLLTPLAQSSLPPYHCLPTKPPTSNPSSPPPFQISNTNSQNPPTFQNNTQHIYPPHLPNQLIHIPLPTPTHLPPFPRPSQPLPHQLQQAKHLIKRPPKHTCHRNSLYRQHGIAARPQKEEQVCSKRNRRGVFPGYCADRAAWSRNDMRGCAGEVREGQGAKSVCEEQPRASFPNGELLLLLLLLLLLRPLHPRKKRWKNPTRGVFL